MPGVEKRDFRSPDEIRTPDKTTVELVNVGGAQIGRYTFQPGWRWAECIKPVVGTDSCQVEHVGYVVSGSLHVEHEDGSEGEVIAGDVYRIAPGHDAWVVGEESAVRRVPGSGDLRQVVATAGPLLSRRMRDKGTERLYESYPAAWVAFAIGTEKAPHQTSSVQPGPALGPAGTV